MQVSQKVRNFFKKTPLRDTYLFHARYNHMFYRFHSFSLFAKISKRIEKAPAFRLLSHTYRYQGKSNENQTCLYPRYEYDTLVVTNSDKFLVLRLPIYVLRYDVSTDSNLYPAIPCRSAQCTLGCAVSRTLVSGGRFHDKVASQILPLSKFRRREDSRRLCQRQYRGGKIEESSVYT